MSDQNIKSRPKYAPLTLKNAGRYHLIITESKDVDNIAFGDGVSLKDFDEQWAIAGTSVALPLAIAAGDSDKYQEFRSASNLFLALNGRLAQEKMGFYLYVIGSEAFIWEVNKIARQFCMSPSEVSLYAIGSAARNVYCFHCQTIATGITTNVYECPGCGASIFVRDHFSKRLNAFAGAQADAEVKGEIPEIEELYK